MKCSENCRVHARESYFLVVVKSPFVSSLPAVLFPSIPLKQFDMIEGQCKDLEFRQNKLQVSPLLLNELHELGQVA